MNYEKPIIIVNNECAEGVYAASGVKSNGPWWCDSEYMKGNFQPWQGGNNTTVKEYYGCTGCRSFWGNQCGAAAGVIAESDEGFRKPEWEQKGCEPNQVIDDTHPIPY